MVVKEVSKKFVINDSIEIFVEGDYVVFNENGVETLSVSFDDFKAMARGINKEINNKQKKNATPSI
jgi:hypothetical protein